MTMTQEEVEQLMVDMSDLQTWCTLLMARSNPVPRSREAWDVIQRARCAIVELSRSQATDIIAYREVQP